MDYQDYIRTELLILVPVLYFIGIGLKKSKMSDSMIPMSIGFIAVGLSSVWVIATTEIYGVRDVFSAIFTAVTQGILVAGASVYLNQLYVQTRKESKKNVEDN